jgi:integrase
MASISTRKLASGNTQIRLTYYIGGKQSGLPMVDQAEAQRWKRIFADLGPVAGEQAFIRENMPQDPEPEPEPEAPPVPTVRDVLGSYIDLQTGITDGTRKDYRKEAERDIYPYLGDLPITSLMDEDVVKAWITILGGKHPTRPRIVTKGCKSSLSGKTIANRHALLSCGAERAKGLGLLPTNPVAGIPLPACNVEEMVFLETWEYHIVRESVTPYWRSFIDVLVNTGVRFSELTALQVSDVNLRAGTIRIKQAHKWDRGGPAVIGPPKSKAGFRTIQVDPVVIPILARAVSGKSPGDFVFVNRVGRIIRNNTFHSRIWGPAMIRAMANGITQRPRVHDLRHTFAAWSLTSGRTNVYMLAKVMGHENSKMIDERYGHMVPGAYEAIASAVGGNFSAALRGDRPGLQVVA